MQDGARDCRCTGHQQRENIMTERIGVLTTKASVQMAQCFFLPVLPVLSIPSLYLDFYR